MNAILQQSLNGIEKRLRSQGFAVPGSRRIVARQIALTAVALVLGIALAWLTLWPLSFAAGAFLAAGNLYFLGKGAETSVRAGMMPSEANTTKASAALAMGHVLLFWVRFVVTGILLYVFLVECALPVLPLLAGLSTVVASLSIMGLSRAAGNSCKEA